MLTQSQLEAIAQVKQGLVLINQTWDAIKAISGQHELDLTYPTLHQLGMVLRQSHELLDMHQHQRAQQDLLQFAGSMLQALGDSADPVLYAKRH